MESGKKLEDCGLDDLLQVLMQTNVRRTLVDLKQKLEDCFTSVCNNFKAAIEQLQKAEELPLEENGQETDAVHQAECYQKAVMYHANAKRYLYRSYHYFHIMPAVEENLVTHMVSTLFKNESVVEKMIIFTQDFQSKIIPRIKGVYILCVYDNAIFIDPLLLHIPFCSTVNLYVLDWYLNTCLNESACDTTHGYVFNTERRLPSRTVLGMLQVTLQDLEKMDDNIGLTNT